MPGRMAFRKDCEECGRSFLTSDKKAKICTRCVGKVHPPPEPKTAPRKGASIQVAVKTQKAHEKRPTSGPADGSASRVSKEIETKESAHGLTGRQVQQTIQEEEKGGLMGTPPTPDRKKEEIELTPAQFQEIVDRYQNYVQGLERPLAGRRKTIAVAMGIPYRNVVLALRQWNQQESRLEALTREERFSIEKAYFYYLEINNSFSEIKIRIAQENGLPLWVVSRYLDLLHDGEKKVQNVPPVSSEQETAILNEYQKYLSADGPPSPPLHALIAERTGVTPKQVYKVLLSYRLHRFREQWTKRQNP